MKPRHYILFAVLVALGIAGGLMLVTRPPELALIRLRDKDFETALEQYKQRLAAGDFSVSVVMPLCQLYLQYGDVEAAIALMERFVRENPSSLDARRELAKYYQFSQRPDDYLKIMEGIASSNPSEKIFRELSDIYNFRGQSDKQIAVIETITEKYNGTSQDFIALASLQAARERVRDAITTLENFEARQSQDITTDTVHFLVSLLLDASEPDKAMQRAQKWLSANKDPDIAVRFAALFSFKGQPVKALALLEPFEAAADTNTALLTELIHLQIRNMQEDRALERLDRLYMAGRLPDPALESFLDLLLTKNRAGMALDVAAQRELSILPSWLLSNLASTALVEKRKEFADYMFNTIGESFMEEYPLLGARVSLSRGDLAGAMRWIEKAEGRNLRMEEKLELASIYNDTGRRPDSIKLLAPLTAVPELPVAAINDLVNLYLESAIANEGLTLFRRLRTTRRIGAVVRGWALLETKAGDEKPVVDWMETANEPILTVPFIENLFFVANDVDKKILAAVSARLLYQRRNSNSDRFQLASALNAIGSYAEALPHLRALMGQASAEIEGAYLQALTAVADKEPAVQDELRIFWSRKLREAGLDAKKQEEAAQVLLDLNAGDTILPVLADLAHRLGDTWLFAYVDAALKANRTTELVQFLTSEMNRPDQSQDEKLTALQLLREHGSPADALPYPRRG